MQQASWEHLQQHQQQQAAAGTQRLGPGGPSAMEVCVAAAAAAASGAHLPSSRDFLASISPAAGPGDAGMGHPPYAGRWLPVAAAMTNVLRCANRSLT
jgi:hypothetical protein